MHPATEQILRWFRSDHLKPELREVVEPFAKLAADIAARFDGPEVSVGLRKLLEAKDATVRAAVSATD